MWEPDLTEFIRGRLEPEIPSLTSARTSACSRCSRHTGLAERCRSGDRGVTHCVSRIDRDAGDNGSPRNVRPVNVAAADCAKTLAVYSGPPENTGLTTTVASRGFAPEGTIPALPLGDILTDEETRTARLVKIDVEGGEPGVVAGMTRFLERSRPTSRSSSSSPRIGGMRVRPAPIRGSRAIVPCGIQRVRDRQQLLAVALPESSTRRASAEGALELGRPHRSGGPRHVAG